MSIPDSHTTEIYKEHIPPDVLSQSYELDKYIPYNRDVKTSTTDGSVQSTLLLVGKPAETSRPETGAEFAPQMHNYFVLLGSGKQKKGGVGTGTQCNNQSNSPNELEPHKWAINRILRHRGNHSNTKFKIQWMAGDKSWLPYHEVSHLRALTNNFKAIGVAGIENL